MPDGKITYRSYLTTKKLEEGADSFAVIGQVLSVAKEHPEWEMDERKTWEEWENGNNRELAE